MMTGDEDNTWIMHTVGIILTIWAGVYTASWGSVLWRDGNKIGSLWAFGLALVSTGASLWYFLRHGFLP